MSRAPNNDTELLEAWRAGDDVAGERLFDRHADAVARFFENKVRQGAEDLVQATFLVMIERRDVVEIDFRAYLFATARNVLRSHVRELARGRAVDPEVDSMASCSPGPSTVAGKKREHRLLLEGLRQLPIESQLVLELHYWEELDARTIGVIIERDAASTRQRLTRARRQLDAAMETIAASPQLLESTRQGLDGWAAELRELISRGTD